MNILFTICGRAGSKGFKNKNLKMFNGVPLVYYSLAAIELFSRENKDKYDIDVVVNTDSRELIDITKKQRVIEINVINRDESLAGDKVPKETVIKDCLIKMIDKKNKSYDMVIDLDITSPLRTVKDIENAVNKKLSRDDTRVVFSVTEARRNPYFNMVKEEEGYYVKAVRSTYTTRQESPLIYDMNASIYVYSPKAMLEHDDDATFFNDKCDMIIMKDTGILDIDSEEDFELMQVVAKYLVKSSNEYAEIKEMAEALLA